MEGEWSRSRRDRKSYLHVPPDHASTAYCCIVCCWMSVIQDDCAPVPGEDEVPTREDGVPMQSKSKSKARLPRPTLSDPTWPPTHRVGSSAADSPNQTNPSRPSTRLSNVNAPHLTPSRLAALPLSCWRTAMQQAGRQRRSRCGGSNGRDNPAERNRSYYAQQLVFVSERPLTGSRSFGTATRHLALIERELLCCRDEVAYLDRIWDLRWSFFRAARR